MELYLKSFEWSNLNRKAQNIKKKNSDKSKTSGISSENSESLYCLEVVGSESLLACLASNRTTSIYTQSNLKLTREIKSPKEINSIGFFKKNENMMISSGNEGFLKCWDLREQSSEAKGAIEFGLDALEQRDLLCVDTNASDSLIGVGTNKNADDALILLFDLRFTQRHLHKLSESHSNDVTQIRFTRENPNRFSSASLDGLVCFYDLDLPNQSSPEPRRKSDSEESESSEDSNKSESESESESDSDSDDESEADPDIMDQCLNTESCVSKIGYLSSSNESSDRLFAITTTNDFFLWDLNTYDTIYEKKSPKQTELDDQTDFLFFDCFYYSNDFPVVCQTNNDGHLRLLSKDKIVYEQQKLGQDKRDEKFHRDIIRSSYWNPKEKVLFTAGEDGFILKWKVDDKAIMEKAVHVEKKRKAEKMTNKTEKNKVTKKNSFKKLASNKN